MFVFNDTMTKIKSHFVPHEIIIYDDRDPHRINRHIKNIVLYKTNFCKTFIRVKKQYVPSFNV